jgi:hypothetical protein
MAAIRIRGTWYLSMTIRADDVKSMPLRAGEAKLVVQKANRTAISGDLHIGDAVVPMVGKVKPGNPSVVSINEADTQGVVTSGGIEAMLYIPPWWPSVKYDYDLITGTMIIGSASTAKSKELAQKVILVSGVQPFA